MLKQLGIPAMLVVACMALLFAATPAWSQAPAPAPPVVTPPPAAVVPPTPPAVPPTPPAAVTVPAPDSWFIYLVVFIVLFGALIAIFLIRASVEQTNWSLAEAVSEETQVSILENRGTPQETPKLGADGKPIMATEMRASSSRLIALMGMMAILLMFLGFGSFALYYFGASGNMPPGTTEAVQLLAAGMTLFAPYVVNKFASLFEGLSPRRAG